MALSNHDQARIRNYLLGHLGEEEQQQIEERLMVEDDLFEELEISKGELIEEYRAGELNKQENHWFESHYLLSAEGKQRHTFAVALTCLKRPSPQPKQLTSFEKVALFFKQKRWAVATVTPVLLATVALLVVFPKLYGPNQTTLSVSLEPRAFDRAPSGPKYHPVRLTPGVGEVKFALVLPASVSTSASYRVVLDDRSGKTKTLKVIVNDVGSLSVVIPAAELPPGLYALQLYGVNADGAEQRVGDYYFESFN